MRRSQEMGRSRNILGINSGTSGDGLDLALVRLGKSKPQVVYYAKYPFTGSLGKKIISAGEAGFNDGVEWLKLDAELGYIIGNSAKRFIRDAARNGVRVDIIGMHGQTVRHLPDGAACKITYQIGDAARVAAITGIPVISDFRRSDTAAGGEGAPLSPILHEALFRDKRRWRGIVNIGGIANATILPPIKSQSRPFAADCGPGNMALDLAMQMLYGKRYDRNGRIASKGTPNASAVENALTDPFFSRNPPKSTGRELFGKLFLEKILARMNNVSDEDKIATITEITVQGIADFITKFAPKVEEIFVCGGGAHNASIINRLRLKLAETAIKTTADFSFDPDYLEAMLWAYLAWCFVNEEPINARNFTGAKKLYIPGKLCLP